MKQRLLAVLIAGILVIAAIAWAGGVFDAASVPEGVIASDSLEITVGGAGGTGAVVDEVTSLSLRGAAVLASLAAFVGAVAWSVAGRRSKLDGRMTSRSSGSSWRSASRPSQDT